MKNLPPHLQELIELICCKGCAEVHGLIADVESGKSREEFDNISRNDRHHVMAELKDIMTVYQNCRA